MYYEDGSVLKPRRWPWQQDTLAFGWLDSEHAFQQGVCPPSVVRRLEAAARNPVDRTRGYHACPFCPPREAVPDQSWAAFGPTLHETMDGETLELGSASLELRADGRRWVAPNLVLHYVTAHRYLPPDELMDALRGRSEEGEVMVVARETMASLLGELSALLRRTEPRWADAMDRHRDRLEAGEPLSDVARDVLKLYSSGMGGWNDVVLQDSRGALTEQHEFHRLRTELFHVATDAT